MARGLVQAALSSLTRSGVDYSMRKGPAGDDDLPGGGEIDLWIRASDVGRAHDALSGVGFRRIKARGHANHHFWVGFDAGVWLKIDVKTTVTKRRGDSAFRRLARATARRFPAGLRRLGPVVALLGPDGAGKGSVVEELSRTIPIALAVVYMGVPRTAPGGRKDSGARPGAIREVAFVVRRLLRAWGLLLKAYAVAWSGTIVVCDRHPIEVLAVRPRRSRIAERTERMLFAHLLPRPDRIVILDAPAGVLLARKGEHSVETLERMRRNYAEEFLPAGATIVSSVTSIEETVASVSALVWEQLGSRRRW